jgi:tripartite ATP-independent transporter DctP family solute receptor
MLLSRLFNSTPIGRNVTFDSAGKFAHVQWLRLVSMMDQCEMGKWRSVWMFIIAVIICLPATANAQKTIKVALALPQNTTGTNFINRTYEFFKSDLEAWTNGSLKVELFYGGVLGSAVDRMNMMRQGAIQMSDASDGNYATIYPAIQVLNIPYLFSTERNAWRVLDGPIGQEIAEDIRINTGIRVLGWWSSGGFRHFSANRPLRRPADFAGLKIRALSPLSIPFIKALKAEPVPIAFGELYTALATGLVDIQENSLSVFRLVRLQEVHKFILLSGHSYTVNVFGINDAFYTRLSNDERAAVDTAAAKAIAFNREESRKDEEEATAALRSAESSSLN